MTRRTARRALPDLIAAGVTTAALAITIPAVAPASDGDDHPGDRPGSGPGLGLVLQDNSARSPTRNSSSA